MAKGVINLQKESGGVTKITSTDGTGVTELTVPESGNLVSVDNAVTDNAIVRFDGTTGKLQNSGVYIDDTGNVGIGTNSPSTNLGKTLHIYNNVNDGTSKSNSSLKLVSDHRNSAILLYGATNTINMFTSSGVSAGGIAMDSNLGTTLIFGSNGFGYGVGSGGTVTQLTSKSTAVTLNKPSGRIIMNNSALAAGASAEFLVNNTLFSSYDVVKLTGKAWSSRYRIEDVNNTIGQFCIRVTNVTGYSQSDPLEIDFTIVKGAVS